MKRKLKSALSLLLTMVMLLSVVQIGVSAAETDKFTISVAEKTAFPGSTVDVDITLKNNPGVSSIGLNVGYDKKILTLDKIVYNTQMGGTTQSSSLTDNPVTLLWINSSAKFKSDANFATLTFKVASSAKEGDVSDITLSYDEENVYNLDEHNVACQTANGKVTVTTLLAGDINKDGKVNNKDVSRLMQYLAHWEVEVNTPVLDCNGDKKINNKDVSRLMQWLAHWDVELHPNKDDYEQIDPNPDCEHNLKKVEAVAATCKKEGHKAYYECSLCGKKFSDFLGVTEVKDSDLVIPKLEHTVVIDAAVAPTKTTEGKTEGSHCSVCGEVIIAQQTIPMLNEESYSITYHPYADDAYLQKVGVSNPNPHYYESSKGLKLQNVKVDGYIFEGWYDGEGANGELIKSIPVGTTGEIELYAKWTPREYTITFNSPLVPVESKKYKVNTGATWTNPSLNGYNFIGWCDENDKLVTNIPVGTTGNITLYANWTSKRNQTRPVSVVGDPIILEDAEKGNIMFAYEIGTIENVPLQTLSQTYQSVGGMKQTYTTQESVTVTKGEAQNVARTVSDSTTDSKAWTLSEDWNDVTSVSETYATQKGWTKEEAEEYSKTASNTYSMNSSSGGSHTETASTGLSGTVSKSNSGTVGGSISREREAGSEFEVSDKRSSEFEVHAGLDFEGIGGFGDSLKIGREVNQSQKNYENNKTSATLNYSATGTNSKSVTGNSSHSSSGTSTWNTSSGYSSSASTSQTQSVRNVLSEEISETKGYGSSYSRGGSKSDTQSFTNTSAESNQYSSAITFSEGTVKTETKSIELGGENEGYYRFVLAGKAHVFAIVGYDVSTSSYYTFTYTVMDDETYTFIDYSKDTASFNDNENGVLPFEVPYFVKEYVDARILQSDGLSVSQEGIVTNYTGADDIVFIPSYYRMNNLDGTHTSIKIIGIDPNAFAGKDIKAISLSNFIEEIPTGAFEDCTELEAILCPGVTKIQAYAFKGCESLREFSIPDTVETLGKQAFDGVEKLSVEASSKNVAMGSIVSGAKQVILNISKTADSIEETEFVVPDSIDYFELRGNTKNYKNIKIKSDAASTIINGINITNTNGTPFEFSSENVILNRINVESTGFSALLKSNETKIGLYGSVKMKSKNGKAIVCRNICLSEVDPSISSSLSVEGNVLLCGEIKGQKNLSINNGNIIRISNEEFEKYAKGCFNVIFDANEGTANTSQKEVYYGSEYGELPVASRDYYTFKGWFTEKENGNQITKDSIFDGSADTTLYAHWESNPLSEWVPESELPANAKVDSTKWTYDLVTRKTSNNSSMPGYTQYNSTWEWGSYGAWSGWSTNAVSRSDSKDVQTQQIEYCRLKGYCCGNSSGYRCYLSSWPQSGYTLRLEYPEFVAKRSEVNSWSQYSQGAWVSYATNIQGYIIGPGTAYIPPSEGVPYFVIGSYSETEYRCRDRSKVYTYYFMKTEAKESNTEITESVNTNAPSESITNVKKWVKYINK